MAPFSENVQQQPWIRTPLLESNALSKVGGCRVYMKMEMFQPSGSFKSRGIGNLCLKALASRCENDPPIRFYSSSGGNAGLAAVTASMALGQLCTVVVPESTPEFMKDKIRTAGGKVMTHGASWKEADDHIKELIMADPTGVYCHPFDHPDIWDGHSTMIDEILQDLGSKPDAIITAVGGGGLFIGLMGAHSLNESLKHNELTTLPAITSIATSLGARTVAMKAFELGLRPNVTAQIVSDRQAASACCELFEDERVAVEAACGAATAIVYSGFLPKLLPDLKPQSKVVLIVCGGNNINLETMSRYKMTYQS
ncbi:putative serine family amino acid catabolism-related protein [Geopyxis carbonaria]|nr:putative serine family amino acid catabolism-related protein [Geopyxis carbonaria]